MDVSIRVLGPYEVTLDGVPVPADAWSRRQSAGLVKLLALSPGRRLHRERVMEALWPGVPVDAAGPRLHKAAHYARRGLGDGATALVLRQDMVTLLGDADVTVDAVEFRRAGEAAVSQGSPTAALAALQLYRGPLLPDDLYEPWAQEWREALRVLQLDLLRLAGRWDDLLREESRRRTGPPGAGTGRGRPG